MKVSIQDQTFVFEGKKKQVLSHFAPAVVLVATTARNSSLKYAARK